MARTNRQKELEDMERKADCKVAKRAGKNKPSMIVGGASVKKLQKIIGKS